MGRLGPRAQALAVAASVVAALAGTAASAQVNTIPTLPTTTSTTTTTTAPKPQTTTTTAAPRTTTTTTTTAPALRPTATRPPPTAPTATVPSTDGGVPLGSGDSVEPGLGPVPPDAQTQTQSIVRTPANNTRRLLAALQPLLDLGMSEAEAVQAGFGRFPVGGEATYSHDWWFPRHVPSFHLHEGTDIFAAEGTPVRAPVDGILEQVNGSIGGLSVYVRQADGGYVYMSHLSAYEPGQVTGRPVKVGDVVGRVGTTGNAQGTPPHVHFELHPAPATGVPVGTQLPAVDPKPFLDLWIEEAVADVPRLIAAVEAGQPRAIIATGLTRRLADGRGGLFAAPSGPPRSQLLWASSASPSGGALRLVEAEAAAAAGELDYDSLVREEQKRIREWQAADSWSRAVLKPLTPAALQPTLGLASREPEQPLPSWARRLSP